MKRFEVRELLIVSLEKMFPSQETSFQRSSLLDFGTMEPIKRKEVSYWPIICIRARELLLLLCLVTELVILWKSTIGKKWVGSILMGRGG